tara:strand:+ start:747 stop:899 length:153 start_codon:yes stop_codon:yes gene_type:complete
MQTKIVKKILTDGKCMEIFHHDGEYQNGNEVRLLLNLTDREGFKSNSSEN